ncbi:unnamed protein product [Rhizophagus irregularis]|nr:unnamed protein product [Rhizophagus irregularis]
MVFRYSAFRRVETLVQDHLLLLVHHRPLLILGFRAWIGRWLALRADGSGKFFFGLILNRQVSIIELAGFPPLELYWMGGFPPLGLYWMGGFPPSDFIGWVSIIDLGFPLRTLLDGRVSINKLGISPSDFIGLVSINELGISPSDFIGLVFPSDFIRSGFLWIFIRLGEDDG